MYPNPMKMGQALKIGLLYFINKIITKGTFLVKVHPPVYVVVYAVMLCKKHYRSCTMKDMGLTIEVMTVA